jgi:cold shock CspA family protein
MKGKIIIVLSRKDFGFIHGEDDNHYFMHRSTVTGGLTLEGLRAGQPVTFDVVINNEGRRAENVRLVDGVV